jgi:hypothetical protein
MKVYDSNGERLDLDQEREIESLFKGEIINCTVFADDAVIHLSEKFEKQMGKVKTNWRHNMGVKK